MAITRQLTNEEIEDIKQEIKGYESGIQLLGQKDVKSYVINRIKDKLEENNPEFYLEELQKFIAFYQNL